MNRGDPKIKGIDYNRGIMPLSALCSKFSRDAYLSCLYHFLSINGYHGNTSERREILTPNGQKLREFHTKAFWVTEVTRMMQQPIRILSVFR